MVVVLSKSREVEMVGGAEYDVVSEVLVHVPCFHFGCGYTSTFTL